MKNYVICSATIEGGENVQKVGYVRRPDVLTASVWSDGTVEIVTCGKVSPEEVIPFARRLGSLAKFPEPEAGREEIVQYVPGVLVLSYELAEVEAMLSHVPNLYPMVVDKIVVPDDVAPHFIVKQIMFGDLPMLSPSLPSFSALGFTAGTSPPIGLTIDEGIEIAVLVYNCEDSPQKFEFHVEGHRAREVACP